MISSYKKIERWAQTPVGDLVVSLVMFAVAAPVLWALIWLIWSIWG